MKRNVWDMKCRLVLRQAPVETLSRRHVTVLVHVLYYFHSINMIPGLPGVVCLHNTVLIKLPNTGLFAAFCLPTLKTSAALLQQLLKL